MKYSSFKRIKRSYKFEGEAKKKEIPAYAMQYIKIENVLATYKTQRDFGIFTESKVILFDSYRYRKMSIQYLISLYQCYQFIMVRIRQN